MLERSINETPLCLFPNIREATETGGTLRSVPDYLLSLLLLCSDLCPDSWLDEAVCALFCRSIFPGRTVFLFLLLSLATFSSLVLRTMFFIFSSTCDFFLFSCLLGRCCTFWGALLSTAGASISFICFFVLTLFPGQLIRGM